MLHPTPASLGKLGGQLRSWYVYLFHLPFIPDRLAAARPRVAPPLRRLENARHAAPDATTARGVRLYRANFIRCLFAPRERYAHAPVQTIVPLGDKYGFRTVREPVALGAAATVVKSRPATGCRSPIRHASRRSPGN